jgi:hypothetical protein
VELAPAGEDDEVPLVGEAPVVMALELIQDGAARGADAERVLEQVDQDLGG